MTVRLGIDVGGTFTKAAAVDATSGAVLARVVVPTTHGAGKGIAEGVVDVLRQATALVERDAIGPIAMVGHSTTLAVNALLEGDLPRVGLIGIGRRPDLGPARKRTEVGRLELSPGRFLEPVFRFVDGTAGITADEALAIVDDLVADGVDSLAVSEAFAIDDPRGEIAILRAAAARGLPACAGHELTGILGLELRTVSALVNAAILPRAAATARVVAEGLSAAGLQAPLVVLRGDGGATDLAGFAALPLRSLFSGPAASVAGVLHHAALRDGIMLEVGGTSTNIALIRGRRPSLAYVRVGRYATALRALDVWVAGVAGGSLARVKGRKIAAVGPRSAHIAGLRYASFADPAELAEATATLIAPRDGDAADHLVVDAAGGRFALTVTCAANALGEVAPDDYAAGNAASARLAYAAAARMLGAKPQDVERHATDLARQHLRLAVDELARPLMAAVKASGADLKTLEIVGVGGGSGALVPALAAALRRPGSIAEHAEILSSIGAAMSLIQAVEERSATDSSPERLREVIEDAEAAAIAAGAAPATVETTTEYDRDLQVVRAIATGALPLEAGLARDELDDDELAANAATDLRIPADAVVSIGSTSHYRAFAAPVATGGRDRFGRGAPSDGPRPWVLLDRRGAVAHRGVARSVLHAQGRSSGARAEAPYLDARVTGIDGDRGAGELDEAAATPVGVGAAPADAAGSRDSRVMGDDISTRPGTPAVGATHESGALAHESVASATADVDSRAIIAAIRAAERHVGPTSVAPPVVIVRGRHVIDCSPLTGIDAVVRAVDAERSTGDPIMVVIETAGAR